MTIDLDEDFELPENLTEFIAFMGFVITEHKVDIDIFNTTILKELLLLIEQELKNRDESLAVH